jgi:hypothetical protein
MEADTTSKLAAIARQLRRFLLQRKLYFIVIFAVLGIFLIFKSSAATFVVAVEAESGSTTTASSVDDTAASGGKAIKFGTSSSGSGGGSTTTDISWPLKVSSNSRYLVDQNDKPFLYTSDTAWPMLGRLSVADAKKLIDVRKAQGFNTIQALLVAWNRSDSGPRGAAFTGGDVTKPIESYWQGVDEIMNYAKQQNMLLSVGPLATADNTGMSASALTTYGNWVGARYKNQGNLMWYVGHDANPSQDAQANFAEATAIKSQIPSALISYHMWGLAYPWDNGAASQSWYGWYAMQWNGNTSPYTYDTMANMYNHSPTRPALNIEPAYEPNAADGTNTSELQVRESNWWSMLAGGMGIVYGGPQGAWNIGASGVDFNATNRPAATQTGYVRTILEKYHWEKLVPNSGTVTGGSGHVQTGVASDKSLIVSYTPGGGTLTVDVTQLSGSGMAQWYSPTTGQTSGAPQTVTNSGSKTFTAPGSGDWVLVLSVQ